MALRGFRDVLLTSVPEHDLDLARRALPEARIEAARLSPDLARRHADVLVLAPMIHDPVTPEVLALFPRLRGVVTRSAGYEHLPAAWLSARGIAGLNLGGYATTSVAHLALAMIIALLRRVPEAVGETRDRGGWDRSRLVGRHLGDVTVGILGVGRIGGEVARSLSSLGTSCLGYDLVKRKEPGSLQGFRYAERLDDLLRASDVLTIHVPLSAATRRMIDARALGLMPERACVVNTARGEVVDQEAVEKALRSGRLGGYAADVLPGEPAPADLARFRDVPNVLLTPHLGAYDRRALDARYEHTARAARAVLTGDAAALADYRVV